MSDPRPQWDQLAHDPLVTAFLRRSLRQLGQTFGGPTIHTPRQVVGEQRAYALAMHLREEDAKRSGREGRSLAADLLNAVPFLWLNAIDPYIAAFTLPRHVIASDLLPYDRCWWTYEGGHPMVAMESGERIGLADGWLVVRAGAWVQVAVMGQPWPVSSERAGLMQSTQFRVGSRWPDDIPAPDRPLVGQVLARSAFLNAPFVESVVQRPNSRHHGRRREPVSPEGVRFVRLRPSIPEDAASQAEHAGGVTEWRHRWLVRGHLRAQWYPRSKEHRLIWVSPYAKGPADKPFKVPVYAVVR